jgi:hypothetical protein
LVLERGGPAKHVLRRRLAGDETQPLCRDHAGNLNYGVPSRNSRPATQTSSPRVLDASAMCRSPRSSLVLARMEASPHLSACLRALTGRPPVARKTTSPITSLYHHNPPSHLVARLLRPATCRPPPEIPTNRPTFISWTMSPAVTPSIHPVPFCRVTGTLGLQQICIDTWD